MRHGSQYRVMHVCRSLGGVSGFSEQADSSAGARLQPPSSYKVTFSKYLKKAVCYDECGNTELD